MAVVEKPKQIEVTLAPAQGNAANPDREWLALLLSGWFEEESVPVVTVAEARLDLLNLP